MMDSPKTSRSKSSKKDSFEENKSEGYFANENGYNIFCKYWSTDIKSPRGLVFMCHGAGEHCLYYGELAELLSTKQLFVFGHDHQGHGQSEGPRMHISDFRHYVRDLIYHIDMVKRKYPKLPVFLIGHSMGGCIAILAGFDYPDYFTGIVLISPAVILDPNTASPLKIFFGKLLARYIPQFPVLWLKNEDVSRDKAVCQKHNDDPLVYHGGLKARWALSMMLSLQEIEKKLDTITWPFIIVHGDADKIIDIKGSETMYTKAASKDKTLVIYPGCYHQPHWDIEPVTSQCRSDILNWVTNRLPASLNLLARGLSLIG